METSPVTGLIVICTAMFAGAFVAGLLLGTALGVIIPEGVRSVYEGAKISHHAASPALESHVHEAEHAVEAHEHGEEAHSHNHEDNHQEKLLGWTLILGFLTMMIADDLFATCTGTHAHSHGEDHIEDSMLSKSATPRSGRQGNDTEELSEAETPMGRMHEKHEVVSAERRRNTVTLGLLIHNSMDGLAMGAAKAAMSSSAATQTVVFWAIMMHHVPASFGYATYLRNSGMEEHIVRRYVSIFSIAAPLSAAVTFFALHPSYLGFFAVSPTAVGTCLLFSAGTFLNVACVHALEEAKRGFPKWGLRQALVLCLGALVPGLASWNHEH